MGSRNYYDDGFQPEFDLRDLRIDTFITGDERQSAARIIHIPTGIQVTSTDEPTQELNRLKAMKMLKERLSGR